jgi:hypothetical protein
MTEINSDKYKELMMLYQITIEDIERTKQWMWKIMFNTLILQSVLLALYKIYLPKVYCVFILLIFFTGTVGIYLTYIMQQDLERFRGKKEECKKYFGDTFKTITGISPGRPFHKIFYTVIVIATFLNIITLWFNIEK